VSLHCPQRWYIASGIARSGVLLSASQATIKNESNDSADFCYTFTMPSHQSVPAKAAHLQLLISWAH